MGFPKPVCTVRFGKLGSQLQQNGVIAVCPGLCLIKELERYCEVIAAIKVRTCNKKQRCLPTTQAIKLLETFGVETDQGLLKASPGQLKRTTIEKYLREWGYDRATLSRQPPAVRFQAQKSNECWHFDLSPSDLKHIKRPSWIRDGSGSPTLMIYSVVDDRSGAAYQEYHCVYGEDVEAALRFLFTAMSPKESNDFPHGIPDMIYMDNGPIIRSQIFHRVMSYLNIDVKAHMPAGSDGRRVTARAKGKVERPFRTVKELHETLYHFREPETEEEANAWLRHFLIQYNRSDHRSESHSRIEDWLQNLPGSGVRAMCDWNQYCHFAREPEKRKAVVFRVKRSTCFCAISRPLYRIPLARLTGGTQSHSRLHWPPFPRNSFQRLIKYWKKP
ncbi:hypothetical protein [Endozoicomonas sp. ONNA2]|uniref:hypothetical protein n=1 Tax=Endozoicomonas sp. ONNA2 TaxID=2828741 RepID=UPI0021474943|nr:hypothetical protein [Endozoicomonas sp. ONNA2]